MLNLYEPSRINPSNVENGKLRTETVRNDTKEAEYAEDTMNAQMVIERHANPMAMVFGNSEKIGK